MGMKAALQTLCVFMHYSNSPFIAKYVMVYVEELSNYFDEVILVTNERFIDNDCFVHNQKVSLVLVKNEGYDLGMFYKVFQKIDPDQYSEIACINDSNILFKSLHGIFSWGRNQQFDFWGIIDSYEKPWFSKHQDNYHIQSHFIVFNQKAIAEVITFLGQVNIQSFLDEKDTIKLRRAVVNEWEIGLSQSLINRGLTCGAYIDSQLFSKLYLSGKPVNVGFKLYSELIKSGYPLIKKKIILKKNRTDIFGFCQNWEKLIRQYGKKDWEIEILIEELNQIKRDLIEKV